MDGGAVRVPAEGTVAILGAGGVGGLLGGLLARAGRPVLFLVRPPTAAVLADRGITVRSGQFGDFQVRVPVADRLAGPVAACLVTCKATALTAALARVPADLLGAGLLVPLLNGVEHVAVLRERYPADQVVPAAIRVESTRVATGEIEHTSPFTGIDLAPRPAATDRAGAVADTLRAAGVAVTVDSDELSTLWRKLAFLAPFALLTSWYAEPIGPVREAHAERLVAVVGEVAAVARAAGAAIDPAVVGGFFQRVPAGMRSSLQRDLAAGRESELDAIGGAVLRAASRYGVPVPVTAGLVADLNGRARTR